MEELAKYHPGSAYKGTKIEKKGKNVTKMKQIATPCFTRAAVLLLLHEKACNLIAPATHVRI